MILPAGSVAIFAGLEKRSATSISLSASSESFSTSNIVPSIQSAIRNLFPKLVIASGKPMSGTRNNGVTFPSSSNIITRLLFESVK